MTVLVHVLVPHAMLTKVGCTVSSCFATLPVLTLVPSYFDRFPTAGEDPEPARLQIFAIIMSKLLHCILLSHSDLVLLRLACFRKRAICVVPDLVPADSVMITM